MGREELVERAKKYIEEYERASGITVPMVNAAEVVEDLVRFWEPTEEEYELWAKKRISRQLKEGTRGFEKMKQELIDYWKATPYTEEPIISAAPDENGNRRGYVSNLEMRWLRVPDGWKIRIKTAQKMR